jgi:hypothetical protein
MSPCKQQASYAAAPGAAASGGDVLPDVTGCHCGETRATREPDTSQPSRALTEQQHAAIDRLIEGRGIADVARELGVHRQTLWRWRTRDSAFMTELRLRRRELADEVGDRVRGLVLPALDVLKDHLHGDNRDIVKIQTAASVLRLARLGEIVRDRQP